LHHKDVRDRLGIGVDIKFEDFGAIVHQSLDPFVQVGDFIQAHLEHDAAEGFASISSFLVEELANYSMVSQITIINKCATGLTAEQLGNVDKAR
jgi:hypothetical protein